MQHALVPCPSCRRHVQVSEGTCPFCKAGLPDLRPRIVPTAPMNISRAAAIAFMASLSAAPLACGEAVSEEPNGGGTTGAGATTGTTSAGNAGASVGGLYGGSPIPIGGGGFGGDNLGGDGGASVMYGLPPVGGGGFGAGGDLGGGGFGGEVGGSGDGGGATPAYGAPAYGAAP